MTDLESKDPSQTTNASTSKSGKKSKHRDKDGDSKKKVEL